MPSTKAAGEAAVLAAMPSAAVMRPSLVFGAEDKFFNRFAAMAQIVPFMPVIAGDTPMQPVYVGDVADAVMAGLTGLDTAGKTFELGGPRLDVPRDPRLHPGGDEAQAPAGEHPDGAGAVPGALAEMLPTKPFTRDQLLLLSQDNVVHRRHARAGRAWHRRNPGRADRPGLPGPLPARRRQAGAFPHKVRCGPILAVDAGSQPRCGHGWI